MAACSPTAHSSPTPCSIPTAAALRTRSPTPPSAHHLRYRLRGLFRRNPSLASAASAAPLGRSWCGRTAAMDESGSAPIFPNARTPEDVFRDFRGRRAGIIKALTTAPLLSFPSGGHFLILNFICFLILNFGTGFVASSDGLTTTWSTAAATSRSSRRGAAAGGVDGGGGTGKE